MNSVKLNIPVIKKIGTGYRTEGNIEVVYESTDLAEAVTGAKEQANKVLSELGAECQLVNSLDEVERLIRKAKNELDSIKAEQERAQYHFDALMAFLGKFGIDGTAYQDELRISAQPILEAATDEDL